MTPEKLCQDLGTYYDKPLSTTQAIPIIKHIDHYPIEKLRALYDLIVNNCEFMPKLSRIVDPWPNNSARSTKSAARSATGPGSWRPKPASEPTTSATKRAK